MTKTPKRIWIGYSMPGYITDGPAEDFGYDTEYVRADLYDDVRDKLASEKLKATHNKDN